MCLFANTKAKPAWIPSHQHPDYKRIFTQLGSTTHSLPFFFFFLQVLSWKLRPAKGLAVLDKRGLCFPCPAGPASLSRNHKAELSPVLGGCGRGLWTRVVQANVCWWWPMSGNCSRGRPADQRLIWLDCLRSRLKTLYGQKYKHLCTQYDFTVQSYHT